MAHEHLETLLTETHRQDGLAHGLPAQAYTSEEFWQLECETVFTSTWVFVGFVHQFSKAGDALPITVGGKPVLLVQNADGEIASFHNVCRHRCLQLVDQPKNVGKLIRCPYHAWAYDLTGALRATPHFGGADLDQPEGFNAAAHGLRPIRTVVWHDWIFINLDGTAEAFEDYAAPLIKRLSGVNFATIQPIGMLDFGEIATNWKFIMENFIEPYHVQFVHKTTTRQPLGDHYTIIDGRCVGSAVDLTEEENTSDSLAVSSRYLTLFPNFIVGRYFPDQLGVYLNIPVGPERMIQKRALYTTDGQTLNSADVERIKGLWWEVHKEDHEMCERMQVGRHSPVASGGGVLSPVWEDSVRAFQDQIVEAIRRPTAVN